MATKAKSNQKKGDRPRTSKHRARRTSTSSMWLMAGVALFVLIIIATIGLSQSTPSVTTEEYTTFQAEWVVRNVLGNPKADITVQVWEDFL